MSNLLTTKKFIGLFSFYNYISHFWTIGKDTLLTHYFLPSYLPLKFFLALNVSDANDVYREKGNT